MINEIQKNEFIAAESLLLDRISGINPLVKTFVLNSPLVQTAIDNAESAVLICMKENGMVDGKLLSAMLSKKFPEVCRWVNVPAGEFRLSEEINTILKMLVGG